MDHSFDHPVFAKNRQRLVEGRRGPGSSYWRSWGRPGNRGCCLRSTSVWMGTLLEAWASVKSFRPKDDDEPPPKGGGLSG